MRAWTRLGVLTLTLASASATGACAHAGKALGILGLGTERQPPTAARPVPPTREARGAISVYERAPRTDWSARAVGMPYSVLRGLVDRTDPSHDCSAMPMGMTRVLHAPWGSESAAVAHVGPFEVGVSGNPGALWSARDLDAERLSEAAMTTAANLGAHGTRMCGFTTFMYFRVSLSGTALPPPVAVLR